MAVKRTQRRRTYRKKRTNNKNRKRTNKRKNTMRGGSRRSRTSGSGTSGSGNRRSGNRSGTRGSGTRRSGTSGNAAGTRSAVAIRDNPRNVEEMKDSINERARPYGRLSRGEANLIRRAVGSICQKREFFNYFENPEHITKRDIGSLIGLWEAEGRQNVFSSNRSRNLEVRNNVFLEALYDQFVTMTNRGRMKGNLPTDGYPRPPPPRSLGSRASSACCGARRSGSSGRRVRGRGAPVAVRQSGRGGGGGGRYTRL